MCCKASLSTMKSAREIVCIIIKYNSHGSEECIPENTVTTSVELE